MADSYINGVGVAAIRDWANGKFALDADLDTLQAEVDEIIAEGGEPNVIETVKVDGTALIPDAQKAVNIDIQSYLTGYPLFETGTDYIGLTSSDQYLKFTKNANNTVTLESSAMDPAPSPLATVDYVTANGGKIDTISVNNTPQTITNKNVNITVPTAVSDLTNDSGYQTANDVQSAVASGVASAVKLKGSVASYSALPSTGNVHGDMYDTLDTGKNYVWIEENGVGRWDDYAGTVDLSSYWISTPNQSNTLEAATVAEINAILNA